MLSRLATNISSIVNSTKPVIINIESRQSSLELTQAIIKTKLGER